MAFSIVIPAMLLASVAAIQVVPVPPTPKDWVMPGVTNIPTVNKTSYARMATQASEQRLGPPMLENETCQETKMLYGQVPPTAKQSEWRHQDPIKFPNAGIGARRRMEELGGMEYQLFLPMNWRNDSAKPYPVVIYLHGYSERKWSVMNSESLPRLLGRNQSTSFNKFGCWCTQKQLSFPVTGSARIFTDFGDTTVNQDLSYTEKWSGPPADCDFADKFEGIVIMPKDPAPPGQKDERVWLPGKKKHADDRREAQGLGPHYPSWTGTSLLQVRDIAKAIIGKFNGDADRVILTGTNEGASAAFAMAKADPSIYSALIITDPTEWLDATDTVLDYMPVLVSADQWEGLVVVDSLVHALKARPNGLALTKYACFVESPKAADPLAPELFKHTADLLYRHPDIWKWAFSLYSGQFYDTKDYSGAKKWGEPEKSWVDIGYNPTMPPLDTDAIVPGQIGDEYNPTRPPHVFGYNPTMLPIVTGAAPES